MNGDMSDDEKYPEHEKLRALRCPGDPDQSHNELVGDFITWLQNEGMVICRWVEARSEQIPCPHCGGTGKEPKAPGVKRIYPCVECGSFFGTSKGFITISEPACFAPAGLKIPTLLGQFFGIDEKKLAEEKNAMLADIRRANAEAKP